MIEVDFRKKLGAFDLTPRFQVPASGVTAIFGASGAGKTSVLDAIAGLSRPDQGRITIDGTALFDSATEINIAAEDRQIGYVFQESRLFPHLSVRGNLDYGRKRRRHSSAEIAFDTVISMLGIGDLLDRKPAKLSGGEKQRVAVGRALLSAPRLLLLDEPLSSLDDQRKAEILPFFERLRDEVKIPMLYVAHAMDEVARMADHLVLMERGKVLAAGSLQDLMSRLDLPLLAERADVGTVLTMELLEHDGARGVTMLGLGNIRFLTPQLEARLGQRVRLRVLARDVAIATHRPDGLSVQNVIPATVTELAPRGRNNCLVKLDLGGAAILALLTADSARRLELRPGLAVFALVKSMAANVIA